MPLPDTFRIAHCSDPHWGGQFNRDIWDDFVAKTVAYRPNLILITGDCVDTPWCWRFRAAKRDIDDLDQQVNDGRSPDDRCHIRMTPGNHDVRIMGLIPVRFKRHFWDQRNYAPLLHYLQALARTEMKLVSDLLRNHNLELR